MYTYDKLKSKIGRLEIDDCMKLTRRCPVYWYVACRQIELFQRGHKRYYFVGYGIGIDRVNSFLEERNYEERY